MLTSRYLDSPSHPQPQFRLRERVGGWEGSPQPAASRPPLSRPFLSEEGQERSLGSSLPLPSERAKALSCALSTSPSGGVFESGLMGAGVRPSEEGQILEGSLGHPVPPLPPACSRHVHPALYHQDWCPGKEPLNFLPLFFLSSALCAKYLTQYLAHKHS